MNIFGRVAKLKTLKLKSVTFFYEKDIDGEDCTNYTYSLYDDQYNYIASAIVNFQGVREIARAYLKGGKELKEAINEWCF